MVGVRDRRLAGGLLVAGMLWMAWGTVAVAQTPAPAAQTGCNPSYLCNAPSATPMPSVAVVVPSPDGPPKSASDVLVPPPPSDAPSAVPAIVVVAGAIVLLLTLATLVYARRDAAVLLPSTGPTPAPRPAMAAPTAEQPAWAAAATSASEAGRWDITAVEQAAAGQPRA